MYARNTSGIASLPLFLQEIDENENAEIAKDKQKENKMKKFSTDEKVTAAGVSSITGGVGAAFSAAIFTASIAAPIVGGLAMAGLFGGTVLLGIMSTTNEKIKEEITTDRMMRLKHKVRIIESKIEDLTPDEKMTCLSVQDYFNNSITTVERRRAKVFVNVTG